MTTVDPLVSQKAPEFLIQRIYVRDLSFEAPQSPQIFKEEWKPELNLQLNTQVKGLEENLYEVVLHVILTASSNKKTIFLAEAKQAGIFSLVGFSEEHLKTITHVACPSILFPYAREVISDLIGRGSFPPLYLSPVNFEALYAQNLEEQKVAHSDTNLKFGMSDTTTH